MEEGRDEPEPGDAGESDRRGSSSFHRDRTPTPSHGFQPGLPFSARQVSGRGVGAGSVPPSLPEPGEDRVPIASPFLVTKSDKPSVHRLAPPAEFQGRLES